MFVCFFKTLIALLHARPIVGTTQLNKLDLGLTHNRTEQNIIPNLHGPAFRNVINHAAGESK